MEREKKTETITWKQYSTIFPNKSMRNWLPCKKRFCLVKTACLIYEMFICQGLETSFLRVGTVRDLRDYRKEETFFYETSELRNQVQRVFECEKFGWMKKSEKVLCWYPEIEKKISSMYSWGDASVRLNTAAERSTAPYVSYSTNSTN